MISVHARSFDAVEGSANLSAMHAEVCAQRQIDSKDGKWDDLKKDDKIAVTEKDGKVTKVEKK